MLMTNSERLAYCTVRICCKYKDGDEGSGTGFFFGFCQKDNGEFIPAIVTNNHVVKNAIEGEIVLTISSKGEPQHENHKSLTIKQFEERWIEHPDPEVDLCVMPFHGSLLFKDFGNPCILFLGKEHLVNPEEFDEMEAVEEVVMVGYPNGIWDSANNMPVIRKGITATHPRLNYNGKQEFLIDAACFGGSSGSPVWLYNKVNLSVSQGEYLIGPGRIKLLGIMYAMYQYTVQGEIVVTDIPTSQRYIALSNMPNNLGFVIRSTRLLDFEPILSET